MSYTVLFGIRTRVLANASNIARDIGTRLRQQRGRWKTGDYTQTEDFECVTFATRSFVTLDQYVRLVLLRQIVDENAPRIKSVIPVTLTPTLPVNTSPRAMVRARFWFVGLVCESSMRKCTDRFEQLGDHLASLEDSWRSNSRQPLFSTLDPIECTLYTGRQIPSSLSEWSERESIERVAAFVRQRRQLVRSIYT